MTKKVLLLTHGNYLDPDSIASGNSVRAYYLAHGMAAHGIEVTHVYPASLGPLPEGDNAPREGVRVRAYQHRQELLTIVKEEQPDVLLIGYWELLEHIPEAIAMPVVLDVVAPRILEAMYQKDRDLEDEVRRMLKCYRRAQRFLVGNERQSHFLLPWLIMAGFDCRESTPIDVIPISTRPGRPHTAPNSKKKCTLVSGGVVWPWRKTERYFDALVKAIHDTPQLDGELVLFAGNYVYAASQADPQLSAKEATWPAAIVRRHSLQPFGKMAGFLHDHCDIGVELAERNIEREFSQSFRALEFLRSGLPIICNDFIELAQLVARYDAGWVISGVADIPALVADIAAHPGVIAEKSRNAIRLVDECFHCEKTVRPLVEFVRNPARPHIGKPMLSAIVPAKAGAASGTAAGHMNFLQLMLRPLGLVLRKISGNKTSSAVAIITRQDVFPADHGAAVKIDRTAWGLSHHVDAVYLITDRRDRYHIYKNGVRTEHTYPAWIRRLGPSSKKVRARAARKGIPAGDAFLYFGLFDNSFIVRTLFLALRHGIAAFQTEFPCYARAALWAKGMFGGRTLIVEHNIEYERLMQQTPDMPPAVANYLKNVEIHLCRQVDAVVTVSERDRGILAADGVDVDKLHVIPHGVDLEAFDHAQPLDIRKQYGIDGDRPILVYHGIYGYPPNLEAMQVMAREILPRLASKGHHPVVLAIGRHPPEEPLHADIRFTGSVENLAAYLLGADVAVVPLLKGGGTRMKILDYFAAGLPVVSTDKGTEGIPVQNGVHALVADDFDRFADAVAMLLEDTSRAREIGARGRTFVEPLDWRNIAKRYMQVFDAM